MSDGVRVVVTGAAGQLGQALQASVQAQSEGKTTILEMMVTRELGDPFRRDALSKPVRCICTSWSTSTSPVARISPAKPSLRRNKNAWL